MRLLLLFLSILVLSSCENSVVDKRFKTVDELSRTAYVVGITNVFEEYRAKAVVMSCDASIKEPNFEESKDLFNLTKSFVMSMPSSSFNENGDYFLGVLNTIYKFSAEDMGLLYSIKLSDLDIDNQYIMGSFLAVTKDSLYFDIREKDGGRSKVVKWNMNVTFPQITFENNLEPIPSSSRVCFSRKCNIPEYFFITDKGKIEVPLKLAAPFYDKLQNYNFIDYDPRFGWLFSADNNQNDKKSKVFTFISKDGQTLQKKVVGKYATWDCNGNVFFLTGKSLCKLNLAGEIITIFTYTRFLEVQEFPIPNCDRSIVGIKIGNNNYSEIHIFDIKNNEHLLIKPQIYINHLGIIIPKKYKTKSDLK